MTPTSSSGDPFATPGFRFYPTEEELLSFYLHHRLAGTSPHIARVIPVVDVYSYHPSELRSMAGEASVRDAEQWFFFCPRAVRELHGGRPARTTPSGYWKATGSPSYVFSSPAGKVIGVKRTMVFYQGRAPTGTKTRWKMNEYKLAADATDDDAAGAGTMPTAPLRMRTEFSLCRVYVNVSTGTLRSFDRRPLNPPGHDHALHRKVPSAAITDDVIAATQQIDRSHGSSPLGAMGIIADDAAIDWSSLITAAVVEDFSFDCTSNIVGAWPHPQIR